VTVRAHRVRGLGAAAALALLLVGVPALLSVPAGWSLAQVAGSSAATWRMVLGQQVSDYTLVWQLALALAVWIAWLVCAVAFVEEITAVVQRRPARRLPLVGGTVQLAIAHLVALVVMAALSNSAPTTRGGSPAHTVALADVVSRAVVAERKPLEEAQQVEPERRTYVVRHGDSLWAIAERELGDPLRYHEIFDLNRGRPQPGGRVLRTPDKIWAGWVLYLPPGVARTSDRPPHGTAPQPPLSADPRPTLPAVQTLVSSAPPPSPSPAPNATATPSPAPTPAAVPARPRVVPRRQGDMVVLPSGGLLALSFVSGLGTVLALQRLRRRRNYQPAAPRPSGLAPRHEPVATLALHLQRAARDGWDHDDEREASTLAADVRPDDTPRASPGVLAFGEVGGHAVRADVATLGGVGFIGDGATDCVRALVLDAVMASQTDRPEIELLIGGAASDLGLGDILIGRAGVRLLLNAEEAVAAAEVALVHRTRLAAATHATDRSSLADREPGEPLPVVVVVARSDDLNGARLHAILSAGGRFGIAALLLGEWSQGTTVDIGGAGEVRRVTGAARAPALSLEGGRAVQASLADALDCLSVLDLGSKPIETEVGVDGSAPSSDNESPPWVADDGGEARRAIAEVGGAAQLVAPIRVALLGGYRVEAAGAEVSTGLRSGARELLAYLALHPRGVSAEALVELLWPDADGERGTHRLHTVVSNLRTTLRSAAGLTETEVIEWRTGRYMPDHRVIDVDVWRFEAALLACSRAQTDSELIEALTAATAAYGGDLLDQADYEWTEALRVDLRGRAMNACVALADLHEAAGDMTRAVDALDLAVRLDPYAEDMHRRLMQVLVRMGRPDAARDRWRHLRTRLGEIDLDPEQETEALAAELIGSTSRPARAWPGGARTRR